MKTIIPLVIIAICLGIYFFYISPTAMELQTLSLKKADYNNILTKSSELALKRDSALTDLNNISEVDTARLAKVLPDTFDNVLFANDLNSIASGQGMNIKDLKINTPTTDTRDKVSGQSKTQSYKTTVVTLKLSGSYSQFVKFLQNLESSLRLVDVTGLTVQTTGSPKSGDVALEYLLELSTYSLR